MDAGALGGLPGLFAGRPELNAKPPSAREAAGEFEQMLIARLLKAAREASEAFGEDNSALTGGDGYLEMAEKRLAGQMAASGVFGFREMIARELAPEEKTAARRSDENSSPGL